MRKFSAFCVWLVMAVAMVYWVTSPPRSGYYPHGSDRHISYAVHR